MATLNHAKLFTTKREHYGLHSLTSIQLTCLPNPKVSSLSQNIFVKTFVTPHFNRILFFLFRPLYYGDQNSVIGLSTLSRASFSGGNVNPEAVGALHILKLRKPQTLKPYRPTAPKPSVWGLGPGFRVKALNSN